MNSFLKEWRDAQTIIDGFRHLEKVLELPRNSITCEYEREGIDIRKGFKF